MELFGETSRKSIKANVREEISHRQRPELINVVVRDRERSGQKGVGSFTGECSSVPIQASSPDKLFKFSEEGTVSASPQLASLVPRKTKQSGKATCEATVDDWRNLWSPDSFGTYYTNGTLTVAFNDISLEKNWYNQVRVPPWSLQNIEKLLETNWDEKKVEGNRLLGRKPLRIKEVNEELEPKQYYGKNNDIVAQQIFKPNSYEHQCKRAKISISHTHGRSLRLSNQSNRGKTKEMGRGRDRGGSGRKLVSHTPQPLLVHEKLCEVQVSPTKELQEVEDKLRVERRNFAIWKRKESEAVPTAGGGGWPSTTTRLS